MTLRYNPPLGTTKFKFFGQRFCRFSLLCNVVTSAFWQIDSGFVGFRRFMGNRETGKPRNRNTPSLVSSSLYTAIKKIIHSSGVHISIADGRPTVLSTGRMIKKLTGSPKDHFPALIAVIRQMLSSPPLRKYELRLLS